MALAFDPSMVQAPQNPEGGLNFFGRLQQAWQDPNVRQALMSTGLNLMRSPGYGQSGWDVAANALQSGVGTLDQLRQRERAQKLETEDRTKKEEQRQRDNTRADKSVKIAEDTLALNREDKVADNAAKTKELERAEKALEEAIRHNKSSEEIDRLRAQADMVRAKAYQAGGGAAGGGGRTPAEIEKLNRLKTYAKTKLGMDDMDADKYAFDYLSTAKGKSPRQLVIENFNKKFTTWAENQFDPTAVPTPEMREQWKREAIAEVKFAEEAGTEVTSQRGPIVRGGGTTPPPASSVPPQGSTPPPAPNARPGTSAPASSAPVGTPNPATLRSIEAWKLKNATPEQIKILIATGGENPAIYGYN